MRQDLKDSLKLRLVVIEKEFILDKNWNELWGKNHQPAVIGNGLDSSEVFEELN